MFKPAFWYYENATGMEILATVFAFIFVSFIVVRLANMFRVYVKTGTLKHKQYDTFIDNMEVVFDFRKFPKLVRDLYTNPNPEDFPFDVLMFALFGLLTAMIGGLIPYILVLWFIGYSIVWLAKYMRKRVEMKEKFVRALKGD